MGLSQILHRSQDPLLPTLTSFISISRSSKKPHVRERIPPKVRLRPLPTGIQAIDARGQRLRSLGV